MNKEAFDKKIDEWSCLSTRIEDHDLLCECNSCMEFLRLGDELATVELDDKTADAITESVKHILFDSERLERVRQKIEAKLEDEN